MDNTRTVREHLVRKLERKVKLTNFIRGIAYTPNDIPFDLLLIRAIR